MRLAVCALSAVLLSGCSWLGMGGHSGSSYGNSGVYGANCGVQGGGYNTAGYGGQGFGGQGFGDGCGPAGGYGVAGQGFDQQAFGGQGFGAGPGFAGQGFAGQGAGGFAGQGFAGQGFDGQGYPQGYGPSLGGVAPGTQIGFAGAYDANALYGAGQQGFGQQGFGSSVTTLGANAPFGSAVGGQYVGGQFGGTQFAGANVNTVQGNPIYVQQPYPAYYGVPQLRAVSGGGFGGAMPFGLELDLGSDFFVGGDFVTAKAAGPATGGGASPLNVSATDAIAYKDAFGHSQSVGLATTYDLDRNTTLLGRIGYNKADGQRLQTGTVSDGTTTEDLFAEFSDLEQVTLEGGLRRYVGGWNNPIGGFRPYVGATAGFTHTDSITIAQDSATLLPAGSNVQQYVDGGWNPTASGVVGAEWQAGPRTALGIETGIRWNDNLNTPDKTDDSFSIPVRLRGRVSF